MSDEKTAVLVVGGSLVGLSTALFLAMNEVPCVLVEPHVGSHPHPRAIGYTARTLEVLHTAGVELPEVPRGFRLSRARVESLAGTWHDATEWTPKKPATTDPAVTGSGADAGAGARTSAGPLAGSSSHAASPYFGAAIAQDILEPQLREGARARGADLRLGTELVRFTQDADGVTAMLRERASGREYELRADYMIACDGNKSAVREALDIPRRGPGLLQVMRSVLFRAPLEEYLAKGVSQFEVEQEASARHPALSAFLTTYGDGRWVLMFKDDVERDEATLRAAITQAIGRTDVPVEILTTGRWELTALIAERFREGRVFLAGDAAHTLPPTRGGYGANTGIHDAHNLAWKIKAVRDGADAALLDSYSAERQPIAWTRLEQTFARPDYSAFARGFADGVTILDETAIELGQLYRNVAHAAAARAANGAGAANDTDAARVARDDVAALPEAATPEQWRGQPGTRAPHVWREDSAKGRVSTLDWFGQGWVLVAADESWITTDAGEKSATVVHADANVREAFGLTATGAALVRPDGYIAWRKATRA